MKGSIDRYIKAKFETVSKCQIERAGTKINK